MKQKIWCSIKQLLDELKTNPLLKVTNVKTPVPLNKRGKKKIKDLIPKDVFYLHQEMNGLNIKWAAKKVKDLDVKGSIKILSADRILQAWKDVVFFDFTLEDERIRNFHPIDFFIDECCVGAFLNESNEEDHSLYLYSFEGDPIKLYLDMAGYINMMIASRGLLYWQYAIVEIIDNKENPVSNRFKVAR